MLYTLNGFAMFRSHSVKVVAADDFLAVRLLPVNARVLNRDIIICIQRLRSSMGAQQLRL